ncbi:hypothetical protein [Zeaxanthinibacter enoshimensis]|uniref:hypothetical protein n=1 Tax=Zeaxanthinibacter enoshimensis TaxID=392009 RepID=UPI00105FC8E6|nr:hypothetical protein [Zeaxanthinibacter enoshimensis]
MLSGFAFMPTHEVNILEIIRLAHFFKARLELLQIGEKTTSKEQRIKESRTGVNTKMWKSIFTGH